jgi:PST family polysaccharide transporter
MVTFGARLTIADFVALFSANTDGILLGRFFGPAPVGLYTRANVLLARPIQQVLTPIGAVLIPVLSRLQRDAERYRLTFLRAFDTLALLVLSFSALCLALAKPMVLVILGSKWTSVAPLFAAFAIVAVSGPLSVICSWIYESQGRGQDQLRNHTAAGAVTIVAYLMGLRWGPLGIIVSLAIVSIAIRLPLVYFLAGRRGPVSTRDLWLGFLSHLPCWVSVVVTTALARIMVENAKPILQLVVCGPVGLAGGTALSLLFPRPRKSIFFTWDRLKEILSRRRAWQEV